VESAQCELGSHRRELQVLSLAARNGPRARMPILTASSRLHPKCTSPRYCRAYDVCSIIGAAILEVADGLPILSTELAGRLLGLGGSYFLVCMVERSIAVGMVDPHQFLRTVSAPIGCPISIRAAGNFSVLF
jgi:hypothetical protein